MSDENITGIVHAYAQAWNETNEAARAKLLEMAWGDDAQYIDPTAQVIGRKELLQHISSFQQQRPGTRIELTSGVDTHHQLLRFRWQMIGGEGTVLLEGIDFGEVASDGRLRRIVGFFGSFPQLS